MKISQNSVETPKGLSFAFRAKKMLTQKVRMWQ